MKDFAKAVGRSAQHVLDTPGAIGEIGGGSGSPSGNGKTVSVATLDLLGRLTRIADKTGTAIIESTKAAVRAAADPENWIPLVPAYKGGLNLGDVVAEAYKAYLEETVTPGVTARKCSDAINALLDDEDAQDEVMGQALAAVIQIWVFGRLVKISVPNPTEVSVGQKVLRYLLDKDHLKGRDKAIWLEKALGFTKRNAEQFISQIRFDPCLAQATALTPHGQKYEQIICKGRSKSAAVEGMKKGG